MKKKLAPYLFLGISILTLTSCQQINLSGFLNNTVTTEFSNTSTENSTISSTSVPTSTTKPSTSTSKPTSTPTSTSASKPTNTTTSVPTSKPTSTTTSTATNTFVPVENEIKLVETGDYGNSCYGIFTPIINNENSSDYIVSYNLNFSAFL